MVSAPCGSLPNHGGSYLAPVTFDRLLIHISMYLQVEVVVITVLLVCVTENRSRKQHGSVESSDNDRALNDF